MPGTPRPTSPPPPVPRDLSPEDLEALLTELVASYKDPAFQAQVARLHRSRSGAGCGATFDVRTALRPLALQAQGPVLRRYSLPPDGQGVELMKHMVQRRIAEGAGRVEALANEARRSLGLSALPDASEPAEHFLAAKADETEKLLRTSPLGTEDDQAGVRARCRQRVATCVRSGELPATSATVLEDLLKVDEIPVASVLSLLTMAKKGISGAMLVDRAPASLVPELEAPTPDVLLKAHVLPSRPALLRGVLDEGRFPPLRDFADAAFLRRLCGHRRVLVKGQSSMDGAGRPVFMCDPTLRLPFADFLDSLEAGERGGAKVPFYLGKVSLEQELPELAEMIGRADSCPRREYGRCFGRLNPQGVFTYLGSGRNTTPVHFDGYENLMLCVCGEKRVRLYPPSDARCLYPVGEGVSARADDFARSAVVPFASFEELPAELRARYGLLPQARPVDVSLGPGDVLYLPACWWHCVEGSGGRNMILNWWFELHPEKKALAASGA